ncbi:MAG: hypothetical protein Q7S84_02725 [bacterium]|nr:hypothetical protein [bacterium]
MLDTILWIVIVYSFIVFVVAPLVLPHMRKVRVPERIPADMQATIDRISAAHPDQLGFMRAALDVLRERYIVTRRQQFMQPWILFRKDIAEIWEKQRGGNQACHVLNFTLKAMLVKSGRFTDGEVTGHMTFYHWNLHQYLTVATDRGVVYVDPWGYLARQTDVGEYGTGFSKDGVPIRT